jgi:Tfp pilus assembly protein PilO
MIVLAVAMSISCYRFLYRPASIAEREADMHLEKLHAENSRMKTIIDTSNRADRERRLAEKKRNLERIGPLLPSAEELPVLMDRIVSEAAATGVEIVLLQPLDIAEEKQHLRYRYVMTITGSFHQISRFLAAVASLPRIIVPAELSLLMESGIEESGVPLLKADFSLETYVLHPESVLTDVDR